MLKFLLYPFSVLYDLITRVRNYLYNTGRRYSIQFDANVIAVGNLTVGGTGKTPHVEYLIRLLKDQYKVATLSRGYGRKTKGFRIADESSSALSIGDEPYQYYRKFGKEITVAVGEERALAIPSILLEVPDTTIILLDDAYQHRAVRPTFNILLSDYNRPFYEDCLLPAGRLRESRTGANRADAVIVTKCPDTMSVEQQKESARQIAFYTNQNTPVFYSGIRYGEPQPVYDKMYEWRNRKLVLFTGLANATPLIEYCRKAFSLSRHLSFSDHYSYKEKDLDLIMQEFLILNEKHDHILITTEKDMVKFHSVGFKSKLHNIPFFYIPIEVYLLKDKNAFDQLVLQKGVLF